MEGYHQPEALPRTQLAVIGVIGFFVIALVHARRFRADRLPIIGAGDTYQAELRRDRRAQGRQRGADRGVSVGNVNGIELKGDQVE